MESALVANPHLAERLRGLTQVRDLVAGLPHDGSVDVTARVMQQIQRAESRARVPADARGLAPRLAANSAVSRPGRERGLADGGGIACDPDADLPV